MSGGGCCTPTTFVRVRRGVLFSYLRRVCDAPSSAMITVVRARFPFIKLSHTEVPCICLYSMQ